MTASDDSGREWQAGGPPNRERRLTVAEQCRRCLIYASLPPTHEDGKRARRFPDGSTLRPRPDMSGWIAEPRFEYVE